MFQFLSPVIYVYTLSTLNTKIYIYINTSSQVNQFLPNFSSCLASLLSQLSYIFFLLKISLFKSVIFTCLFRHLITISLSIFTDLFMWAKTFGFLRIWIISWCACVPVSLFFFFWYLHLVFRLEINCECKQTNRKKKFIYKKI